MASTTSCPTPPPPVRRLAAPATMQEYNSVVTFRYQGASITATSAPLPGDNHNVFRLTLRRHALDHRIYQILKRLTWLRLWIGYLRPVWLLPSEVVFKKRKVNWESEFEHEIEEYVEKRSLQGQFLPIYYGRGVYDDGVEGMLLSYCGTNLNERQDLSIDALQKKLGTALSWLADRNLVHKNLNLNNILYDGRKIWIIDLEQTSKRTRDFSIDAEVNSVIHWFKFRQKAMDRQICSELKRDYSLKPPQTDMWHLRCRKGRPTDSGSIDLD